MFGKQERREDQEREGEGGQRRSCGLEERCDSAAVRQALLRLGLALKLNERRELTEDVNKMPPLQDPQMQSDLNAYL